jgi:hypothetical protein
VSSTRGTFLCDKVSQDRDGEPGNYTHAPSGAEIKNERGERREGGGSVVV